MKILHACWFVLLVGAGSHLNAADKPRTGRVGNLSYDVAPAYTRLNPRAQPRYLVPGANGVYTVDGLTLDLTAVFWAAPGRPLGGVLRGDSSTKFEPFEPSMAPAEIAELHGALLTQPRAGFSSFKLGAITPATFAGVPGFRYEFELLRKDGLQVAGMAYGGVIDKRLYLITYAAPRTYFFEKNLPMAEAMAKSAKLVAGRRGAPEPEPKEEGQSERDGTSR